MGLIQKVQHLPDRSSKEGKVKKMEWKEQV